MPSPRPAGRGLVLAMVFALVIVAAGGLMRLTRTDDRSPSPPTGSTVPDTTVPEATLPETTIPEFTVPTSAVPGPTTTLAGGGRARVEVPDVVGLARSVAEEQIRAVGLETTVDALPLPNTPEGFVLSQIPLPGEQLPKGSTVALVVSAPA